MPGAATLTRYRARPVVGLLPPDSGYQFPTAGTASTVAISTVATFNNMRLYWKPVNHSSTRRCLVRYRVAGTTTWFEGHPLTYDGRSTTTTTMPTTAARQYEYRGPVVYLQSGTTYNFELYLEGHGETQSVTATTWSEVIPIGSAVTVSANTSTTRTISSGGTENGYVLYDFTGGATIDVNHAASHCIDLQTNARYVIIRGADLRGASLHGIMIRVTADAGTKPLLVIEDCDITDWGTNAGSTIYGRNLDSGIGSPNSSSVIVGRIVVRNCRIHHPATDSNSWKETNNSGNTHPEGPQAISLQFTFGQNVFQNISIYSDADHKFNDGMGGTSGNFSFTGFPGANTDICGCSITGGWDDGIEAEGGGQCVLIYECFVDLFYAFFATASVSIGPTFVFRCVGHSSLYEDGGIQDPGRMNKNRNSVAGGITYGGGACYWYHNTLYRLTGPNRGADYFHENGGGLQHHHSFNNIMNARTVAIQQGSAATNSFGSNLYTGSVSVPSGQSAGIKDTPIYDPTHESGPYTQAPNSPARSAGIVIPNFTGVFDGAAPDIGAQQRGQPALFGVR